MTLLFHSFCVISPFLSHFSHVLVLLSGSSEACVPGAAVPGGGTDTDGVYHVWRLEVWTGKPLPAGSRQQFSFHVLHPPRYAHIDPERPILNIGNGYKAKQQITSFSMSAYMIRASLLCSHWLLQLVSIGYGRAHQSEFLLIVSREVKGEESALPNNSGEVCLTNFCPRAGHCMVPMLSIHTPLAIVVPSRHIAVGLFFGWFFSVFICTACSPVRLREHDTFFFLSVILFYYAIFYS